MFLQNDTPLKARRANYIHMPGKGPTFTLSGPQERYANSRSPDFCSLSYYSCPLQNALQKPLLRMNSIENNTSFMKLVVHIARLIIANGIMILYILFEDWWSVDAEPDWPPIYIDAISKRNTSAASEQLRHLGRSTIAIASS